MNPNSEIPDSRADVDSKLLFIAEHDELAKIFLPSNWTLYRKKCFEAACAGKDPETVEFMKERKRVFSYVPSQSEDAIDTVALGLPLGLAEIAVKYPYSAKQDEPPPLEGDVAETLKMLEKQIRIDMHRIEQQSKKNCEQYSLLMDDLQYHIGAYCIYKDNGLQKELEKTFETIAEMEIEKENTQKTKPSSKSSTIQKVSVAALAAAGGSYRAVDDLSDDFDPNSISQERVNAEFRMKSIPSLKQEAADRMGKSITEVTALLKELVKSPTKRHWVSLVVYLGANQEARDVPQGEEQEEPIQNLENGNPILNAAGMDLQVQKTFGEMYVAYYRGERIHDEMIQMVNQLNDKFIKTIDVNNPNRQKAVDELEQIKKVVGDLESFSLKINKELVDVIETLLTRQTTWGKVQVRMREAFEFIKNAFISSKVQWTAGRYLMAQAVDKYNQSKDATTKKNIKEGMYQAIQPYLIDALGVLKMPSLAEVPVKLCLSKVHTTLMRYDEILSCFAQGRNALYFYVTGADMGFWEDEYQRTLKAIAIDVVLDTFTNYDVPSIIQNFLRNRNLGMVAVPFEALYRVGANVVTALRTVVRILSALTMFAVKYGASSVYIGFRVVHKGFNLLRTGVRITLKIPYRAVNTTCLVIAGAAVFLQLGAIFTMSGRTTNAKIRNMVNQNIHAFTEDNLPETIARLQESEDEYLKDEVNFLTSNYGPFGEAQNMNRLTCFSVLASDVAKEFAKKAQNAKEISSFKVEDKLELKHILKKLKRRFKEDHLTLTLEGFIERYSECDKDMRAISTLSLRLESWEVLRNAYKSSVRYFLDPSQDTIRNQLHSIKTNTVDMWSRMATLTEIAYHFPEADSLGWQKGMINKTYVHVNDLMDEKVEIEYKDGQKADMAKYGIKINDRALLMQNFGHRLYKAFVQLKQDIPNLDNGAKIEFQDVEYSSLDELRKGPYNNLMLQKLIEIMVDKRAQEKNDHDLQVKEDYDWKEIHYQLNLELIEYIRSNVIDVNSKMDALLKDSGSIMTDAGFIPSSLVRRIDNIYQESAIVQLQYKEDQTFINAYWFTTDMLMNIANVRYLISYYQMAKRMAVVGNKILGELAGGLLDVAEAVGQIGKGVLYLDGGRVYEGAVNLLAGPKRRIENTYYDDNVQEVLGGLFEETANIVGQIPGFSYFSSPSPPPAQQNLNRSEEKLLVMKLLSFVDEDTLFSTVHEKNLYGLERNE